MYSVSNGATQTAPRVKYTSVRTSAHCEKRCEFEGAGSLRSVEYTSVLAFGKSTGAPGRLGVCVGVDAALSLRIFFAPALSWSSILKASTRVYLRSGRERALRVG